MSPRVPDHNINLVEKALFESFKMMDSTDVNQVTFEATHDLYSLYNDGIQKFCIELNGVMV